MGDCTTHIADIRKRSILNENFTKMKRYTRKGWEKRM